MAGQAGPVQLPSSAAAVGGPAAWEKVGHEQATAVVGNMGTVAVGIPLVRGAGSTNWPLEPIGGRWMGEVGVANPARPTVSPSATWHRSGQTKQRSFASTEVVPQESTISKRRRLGSLAAPSARSHPGKYTEFAEKNPKNQRWPS